MDYSADKLMAAPEGGIDSGKPRPRRSRAGLVVALIFVAATAAIFVSGAYRFLSFSTLVAYQASLNELVAGHYLVAIAAFILLYAVVVAFSIPGGLVLTVSGGFLFGGLIGGLFSVSGATIGVACLYLIAKTAIGPMLTRKLGGRLERIRQGFSEGAWSYLFFLRLVPLFPFWVVNLAVASLQVPFVPLLVTTLLGTLPATLAFSFAGASFADVVRSQATQVQACQSAGQTACGPAFDPSQVLTPKILVTLLLLGLLALIPVLMKARRRRTGDQ